MDERVVFYQSILSPLVEGCGIRCFWHERFLAFLWMRDRLSTSSFLPRPRQHLSCRGGRMEGMMHAFSSFHTVSKDRFHFKLECNASHPFKVSRIAAEQDGTKADDATKHNLGEHVKMQNSEGKIRIQRWKRNGASRVHAGRTMPFARTSEQCYSVRRLSMVGRHGESTRKTTEP